MDLLFTLTLSFIILVFSAIQGYFIAYPLIISMGLFILVLLRKGFPLKNLMQMAFLGSQKSFSVLRILLLIGAVTASWMAAGTVPAIVYYGIQLINPQYFILAAFSLTSLVSILIGTSFGTVSTIGIALMMMASGSTVNPHLIAGAIIAGAYLGDRCSPMSSSANLVAIITNTQLYLNIKNMIMTAILPLIISCLLYLGLSWLYPVQIADNHLLIELSQVFNLSPIVLSPAIAILLLALFRIDVQRSMLISIGVAIALAVTMQPYSGLDVVRFMVLGFRLPEATPLQSIVIGGGVLSMVKISIIVLISTAFAGIFAGTQVLRRIEQTLEHAKSRSHVFCGTTLIGIAAAAFGCTQTIAILLTQQLVQQKYKDNLNDYELAVDLENTVVVLSPLIPWNIAGLVPATILMTDAGFVPYAFYLYLIPLCYWIQLKLGEPKGDYATHAARKR